MFKQMKKKLNNMKGFTLAELLVVIAILAILIAIAIPVFSNMVADSNLRVNQANVRSVRSAAVAHILTRPDEKDSGGSTALNAGIGAGKGWVAVAEVDNSGDISNLKVFVISSNIDNEKNGIIPGEKASSASGSISSTTGFETLSDNLNARFATLRPTSDGNKKYTVQAVIKDLDPKETGTTAASS